MTTALATSGFDWVCQLVRRESAIVLAPGKEYLVEARLMPLARQLGLPGVAELVERVRARPEPALTRGIVEALTTNETSWFRDGDPFTALTGTVVPALQAARRPGEPIQIWSAACSSGQEAYTIAMLLADALPGASSRVRITATDLSRAMVDRTRAGRFSQLEVNRGLPAPMLVRHFSRVGAEWEVSPALRQMVTASELNLAAPLPRLGPFDVVYLRNVLIYFDPPTKREVLRKVRQVMRPDGWLFLGAAETTLGVDDSWERVPCGRGSAYRPTKGK
ncbi:protein-glutamate O-methyltransferase CheR [Klenkia sp. PcliD-1-E]|uniref:CheR family methyltransferase n=1 Tax=Klenkia sp. PcliD-1-E TaxID=2954492 RepID=UPI00209862C9|nr:CheR family methyltransferase [Klenkia sp. PcliD-1-E]MCO7219852.1 methyltransferase [Klenkia sp. PcliD-1-E]